MITKELIERINQLARKARSEGLSPEEKEEQQELRKIYLAEFRKNFKAQLDAMHAANENIGVAALAEGVKFYRYYLEKLNER